MSEEERFREKYETHVGYVLASNMKACLGDMVPEVIPTVFDGVDFPRGDATDGEIKAVYKQGDKWYGETVYDTPSGQIGLRSIWWDRDGVWLAGELENFPLRAAAQEA
jgi:hypothetical protein